ncbi:hypothetical protein GMRT_12879 [Giardia muris]|uniref:Uncharacterized protein n=1 Tax=Giardia muris TaxID=5742 RepID=A0A4Z1SP59_GIAMU|nr:hypothetical protein GMRT_12879 [Giardia muris]|eukprot:TNJ27602.1 hypothetical protein GMRT_12879 [Giardia muris]
MAGGPLERALEAVEHALRPLGIELPAGLLLQSLQGLDSERKRERTLLFRALHDLVLSTVHYGGQVLIGGKGKPLALGELWERYGSLGDKLTAVDFLIFLERSLLMAGFVIPLTVSGTTRLDQLESLLDFDTQTIALAICYLSLEYRLVHRGLIDVICVDALERCVSELLQSESVGYLGTSKLGQGVSPDEYLLGLSPEAREIDSEDLSPIELMALVHEEVYELKNATRRLLHALPRWTCCLSHVLHPADVADVLEGKLPFLRLDDGRNLGSQAACLQRVEEANRKIQLLLEVVFRGIEEKVREHKGRLTRLDGHCGEARAYPLKGVLFGTPAADESVHLLPFVQEAVAAWPRLEAVLHRRREAQDAELQAAQQTARQIHKRVAAALRQVPEGLTLRRLRDSPTRSFSSPKQRRQAPLQRQRAEATEATALAKTRTHESQVGIKSHRSGA